MTPYQLRDLVPPALGTLAGVVTAEALRTPIGLVTSSVIVTVLISAILIFLLEELFRAGFKALVSTRFAKRIIFGEQYFDGLWIDEVKLNNKDVAIGYGIVTVADSGGDNASYSGVNYDVDGEDIGVFHSKLGKVVRNTLIYMYEAPSGTNEISNMGTGDIQFVGRDRFSGSFFDIKHKRWHKVTGKRLRGAEAKQAQRGERSDIKSLIAKHFAVASTSSE